MHRFLLLLIVAALLTACVSVRTTEEAPALSNQRVISTPSAPAAIAAYSQGIQVGETLWVAGQIGLDPATRELVPGGIREETRRALENCKAILAAGGFNLKDVVQVQVLLADINDYLAMNEVYGAYFPDSPPARAAYAVAAIPRGAKVEIVMTAARGRPAS
jgi:2-iminobutanoate/2-iminopropanoate deaminase